jgi:Phage integrase family
MKTKLSPNPTQSKTANQNRKSGSEVAQCNSTEPVSQTASSTAKARRTLPRTHADYWKSRLFRRSYTQNGAQREVNDLYVRIQYGGRREFLPLNTTNQDAAARKAASLYTAIVAKGWDAALTDTYKDGEGAAKLEVSFGDYLTAVDATRRLRARTFLNYRNCLRTIVAECFGIRPKKGENKFDYRAGGNQAWTKRIDEIRLERLTPDRVNRWKRERVASAGHAPAAIASARRTVNSYLRCARSLFSVSLIRELKGLKLPETLAFDGVELEETGSQKYVSKINAQALIAAAKNELKTADPEAYKAFLLGLFAGMRKAEIDSAEWRMVDFAANILHLEETEWLHLKTRDATAQITVDPEVIAELRALLPAPTDKPGRWSQFILQSARAPQPDSLRPYYRCEETFDRLNAWLRGKGIRANKPLHELRKEVGAIIATEHGIFAASKFLRHADITTTARHYADHKARINVGLGRFLDTDIKPAAPQAVGMAVMA